MVKSELKVRLQGSTLRGFGGKEIPVHTIAQQWQNLAAKNKLFHQQDNRWQSIIPTIFNARVFKGKIKLSN